MRRLLTYHKISHLSPLIISVIELRTKNHCMYFDSILEQNAEINVGNFIHRLRVSHGHEYGHLLGAIPSRALRLYHYPFSL